MKNNLVELKKNKFYILNILRKYKKLYFLKDSER